MKQIRTATLALALAVAMGANAEGYQVNTLSAKQEGMGHVGVAMKLGAESQFFNPAGMGFLDKMLDISGSFTAISATAEAKVGADSGAPATYTTDNGISTPIAVSAAFNIYDNLKGGISFYTPYGSSIKWGDNWPGAVLNQSVDLKVYTIQPTLAWRILPNLSVGAGLTVSWGKVDLNKGLVSAATADRLLGIFAAAGMSTPMGIDPAYRFGETTPASVNLTGTTRLAVGVNLGVMYDITDRITFGVQFRTRTTMKVNRGDASLTYANQTARTILEKKLNIIDKANFKSEMPCPAVLAFGLSYRPVDRLVLAADAQFTGWKTYRQLDITFLDPSLEVYDQHIEKNYSNAWAVKVGAQYSITNRFDIRAGVMIDTTPVNTEFYNPETPGMTKINPSVGFSFSPVKGLSIDAAMVYVAGLGRDNAVCVYDDLLANEINTMVPGAGLSPKATFKADYKAHAFVPSIGLSYCF